MSTENLKKSRGVIKKLLTPAQANVITCQFITNDDSRNPQFCTQRALLGRSWCLEHYNIVHEKKTVYALVKNDA